MSANLNVNFSKTIGKIKPMHAVGQPPFKSGFNKIDFTPMQILKDANIPFSRLHDVGGAFGSNRYVDIPNIFRNFDADVNDPASYDFAFTDELIKALIEYGIEPYFRLGVSIENQSFIKAYHIHPPKDYDKWARICEHIIRHYNEGWANGYNFNIKYWEIWNEPENRSEPHLNQMWTGTPEEFYRLYDVTAKHLKNCFGDKIKVGGYAACGFYGIFANPEKYGLSIEKRSDELYHEPKQEYRLNFFYGFLDYITEHKSPIDFFSWHTYADVDVINIEADFVDKVLNEYGLGNIETHLNEWNLSHDRKRNTSNSYASTYVMAMMLSMQHKKTDMLMYYDAKYLSFSAYCGLYDTKTEGLSCIYYAFKAFGELYSLGNEAECNCCDEGVYSLAATNGDKKMLIIANKNSDKLIQTNIKGFNVHLIDQEHLYEKADLNSSSLTIKENQIAVLKNYE